MAVFGPLKVKSKAVLLLALRSLLLIQLSFITGAKTDMRETYESRAVSYGASDNTRGSLTSSRGQRANDELELSVTYCSKDFYVFVIVRKLMKTVLPNFTKLRVDVLRGDHSTGLGSHSRNTH